MSLDTMVLPKDLVQAQKLNTCCIYCLHQASSAYINGKYDRAENLIEDYKRSKRDLDKLIQRKQDHEKLKELVKGLSHKGVNITIVNIFQSKEGA